MNESKFRVGDLIRERQRTARQRRITHIEPGRYVVTVQADPDVSPRRSRVTRIAWHRLGVFDLTGRAS